MPSPANISKSVQLLRKVHYSRDDLLVIVGGLVDKGPDSLRHRPVPCHHTAGKAVPFFHESVIFKPTVSVGFKQTFQIVGGTSLRET